VNGLDSLLYLQLVAARLGEQEFQDWWKTDIAFKLGGADFLLRLTDPVTAPLAAGDGVLRAARQKEDALIADIPGSPCRSLFCPPTKLRNELDLRFRHFKRYPDDTPAELLSLLDSATEWTTASLKTLLAEATGKVSPAYEGTSFGRELRGPDGGRFRDEGEAMRALAAAYLGLEKGRFSLPYYRDAADGR